MPEKLFYGNANFFRLLLTAREPISCDVYDLISSLGNGHWATVPARSRWIGKTRADSRHRKGPAFTPQRNRSRTEEHRAR